MMEDIRTRIKGSQFLLKGMESQDIFTPEDFSGEHRMIQKTARQFIEKEVEPFRDPIEKQDFKKIISLLKKAGDLGLLAHSIPESYGGLGLDKISKGIVGEAIGHSSGYGVAHSNHTCIATLPITYFGTPEQKEKYLPKMASGEYIGAYCLTEPNAGSDALAAKTTAVLNEEGTHYILNGTKIYITNAAFSNTFIVYAKVDGERFTAFIVEKSFPGLSLGPEENKMGIKGSSTRSVILEDCRVPAENLLGEVGKGHVIALNVLNLGRFNLGSACMGAAKHGLKKAVHFVQERKQFKQRIADFAASKEKIAKLAARLYAAESLQYRTAHLLEDALGSLDEHADLKTVGTAMSEYATECAICKVYGSETLDVTADEALQLHGGAGFIQEYGMEQLYRDSRINRIFEGTNEINRLLIPTHFFRKAMKGEVDLESALREAASYLEKENDDEKDDMLKNVETLRHLFLLSAGLAYKRFGEKLMHEQEILMMLADLAILTYAAESAILRTMKEAKQNGEEQASLKIALSQTLLDESLWEAEKLTRKLILELAEGEKAQQLHLLVVQSCNRCHSYGQEIKRNRMIAEKLYDANRYIC